MDRERTLLDQTVLVEGDTITALAPSASLRLPPGVRVIDGRGKVLLPGLADLHTHLTRREDLGLYLALGVTTVRNMWGAPMHLAWREQIRAGILAGPMILTAGPILDGPDPVHDGSLVLESEGAVADALALHRRLGYDFLKVYVRLTPPIYRRLLAGARAAGLTVAGHLPREVGLEGALAAGQAVLEHTNIFHDALQADDSPVRGKHDRESRARRVDFLDEKKIPALARRLAAHRVWVCPTRVVLSPLEPPEQIRARLARPELKLVPPFETMIWTPLTPPSATEAARNRRELALADRLIRGLRDAGVRLLVGTDLGNPLVVAGHAVHEELELLVRAGLTPYEALRAATAAGAELTGDRAGVVAPGRRADLLLLERDPLRDVRATRAIAGVMVRGRWLGPRERQALLAQAELAASGRSDPFAGHPAPAPHATVLHRARFAISWREVVVGHERMLIEARRGGGLTVRAQALDPHQGLRSELALELDAAGALARLRLAHDGATGRGVAEARPDGDRLRLGGELLGGVRAPATELPRAEILTVGRFLAGLLPLRARLLALGPRAEDELSFRELALGSALELVRRSVKVTRLADEDGERRFAIATGRGAPRRLALDRHGFPAAYELPGHGASVRFRQVGP
jgi:imidazolonepropionase-like amidohydrolase